VSGVFFLFLEAQLVQGFLSQLSTSCGKERKIMVLAGLFLFF